MSSVPSISGLKDGEPLALLRATVTRSQINALGHLKASEYVRLFDDAIPVFFPVTGLADKDLRHGPSSPFLMDLHACYLSELRPGETVAIAARHLDHDARRARLILTMDAVADGRLCATCELLLINMDVVVRKPIAWSSAQLPIWEALRRAHASLPQLPQAGRAIGPLTARG